LTRGTTAGHIARAALEGIAFQVADILDVMKEDSGIALDELRVDGGACSNNLLMQFQADILGVPSGSSQNYRDDSARGGLSRRMATGFWKDKAEVSKSWQRDRLFAPARGADEVTHRRRRWNEALKRAGEWEERSSDR